MLRNIGAARTELDDARCLKTRVEMEVRLQGVIGNENGTLVKLTNIPT